MLVAAADILGRLGELGRRSCSPAAFLGITHPWLFQLLPSLFNRQADIQLNKVPASQQNIYQIVSSIERKVGSKMELVNYCTQYSIRQGLCWKKDFFF